MSGVIVLGFPRSGTTLLRRLFDAHEGFAAPPETGVFSASARFLAADRLGDGTEHSVVSGLALAGFPRDEVHARMRRLAFSFLDDFSARAGKPRWVEKNPFDVFHADALESLLGDEVAWVGIVRHGLDVVVSNQDLVATTQFYARELHEWLVRCPRPLEAFARAWADTTPRMIDLLARRKTAVWVRYEDLVREPDTVMARIMGVLGESWPEGLAASALQRPGALGFGDWKTYQRASVDESSVGRWSALSTGTLATLGPIVQPVLEQLGYPPVAVKAAYSQDEALRRHELALMLQAMRARSHEP